LFSSILGECERRKEGNSSAGGEKVRNSGETDKRKWRKSNKHFHRKLSKYTLFISKLPLEIVA